MLLQHKKCSSAFEPNKVQIMHSCGDLWITAATVRCEEHLVNVFDSVYDSIYEEVISNVFGPSAVPQNIKIT